MTRHLHPLREIGRVWVLIPAALAAIALAAVCAVLAGSPGTPSRLSEV